MADAGDVDGNGAAGDLADVFTFDTTVAVTTCAACGRTSPMGGLRAHTRAPGIVLRCASCGAVQLRLVRGAGRAWLDLRGVEVVEIEL